MKTAALSMGPSWSFTRGRSSSIYTMILDVDEISSSRTNSIELPEPRLIDALPSQIAAILTKAMVFPKDAAHQKSSGHLRRSVTRAFGDLERSFSSPNVIASARRQRGASSNTPRAIWRASIVVNWEKDFVSIFNNRRIEAFDPTYWMQNARHIKFEGLSETRSR